ARGCAGDRSAEAARAQRREAACAVPMRRRQVWTRGPGTRGVGLGVWEGFRRDWRWSAPPALPGNARAPHYAHPAPARRPSPLPLYLLAAAAIPPTAARPAVVGGGRRPPPPAPPPPAAAPAPAGGGGGGGRPWETATRAGRSPRSSMV